MLSRSNLNSYIHAPRSLIKVSECQNITSEIYKTQLLSLEMSFSVMCFSFLRLTKFFRATFNCPFTDIASISWNRNCKGNKTNCLIEIQHTDNSFSENMEWSRVEWRWNIFGITNKIIESVSLMFKNYEMTQLQIALCVFTGTKENWRMLILLYHYI